MKTTKLFEFRRVRSKLLHSMIVERKNGMLKKGMLSIFFAEYAWVFSGINLKKVLGTFTLVNFVKHS